MRFDHEIFIIKALKLTDAEKTQTFENFVRGRSRQNFTETCLGHLGPSLNYLRSWFSLTIFVDLRLLQENRDPVKFNFLKMIHTSKYVSADIPKKAINILY
jgi:hypothetical protein